MNVTILDVVIGMVFVYVLFSLLSSAVMEWVARLLRLRAKLLSTEIPTLVGSGASGKLASHIHTHPLISGIQVTPPYPTYIPPQHFALTLIDLAIDVDGSTPSTLPQIKVRDKVRRTNDSLTCKETSLIHSLIGQGTSIMVVQSAIEKWFSESMERLSGLYKRKTYVYLLFISIGISFLFGVDSIRLARDLYSNQPLRQGLIKAEQGNSSGIPVSQLPIGWTNPRSSTLVPGCLLTGLALTFGAPFWFDLLGRFANLRQTGVPPGVKGKIVAQ